MASEVPLAKVLSETDNQPNEASPAPKRKVRRRSFLKGMGMAAGAVSATSLLSTIMDAQESKSVITVGDVAILRFLAAAEILETDLWQQYNELGGIPDSELPLGSGNRHYTRALQKLDGDMPQYIHDNTEDELTHEDFINAYLVSRGAEPVNLD